MRSCQEGERSRELTCLQGAFTPSAGDLKTTKTDKKHGSRQESHPHRIDRRLTGLAGPDYDATISFGLPFEPKGCLYGKSWNSVFPNRLLWSDRAYALSLEKHLRSWTKGHILVPLKTDTV